MRYKISPHIEFNAASRIHHNQVNEEALIITDKSNDTSFYINDSIKNFIQKFETPKSFKDLTAEVSNELNIAENKIKKIITPFFNYCKYRHFILPEKTAVKINIQAPLFVKGNIVDEYKIETLIDSNNDVEIYKGTKPDCAMHVIIKLLKKNTEEDIAALKREYNFLMLLNDTNVAPQPFAFKQKENYTYFIQEFIDGPSLPQFINRNKNLHQKDIVAIAEKIINAFTKIHNKGIVHGDIHPSNIIVTPALNIKILDFGLALNDEKDKDAAINFGGAYFYMPPERIAITTYKKFTTAPDFYSDVFQIGVVLFMFFYNVYPFNGVTWEELATEIKEKEISFPAASYYDFNVKPEIKAIIKKCVAKKTAQRFADAMAIQTALLSKKKYYALAI